MDVLFLETDHDAVTRQVHAARRAVFTGMGAGMEVHLFSRKATAPDLIAAGLAGPRWRLFSGLGHGDDISFEGYVVNPASNNDVANVADTPRTLRCFSEKIAHLYSCNTARQLGPEMVRRGAQAFIGYTDYVILASTATLEEWFVSVSAAIDRSILAGDHHHATRAKADWQYQGVRKAMLAPGSPATPTDVASFDLNYLALAGPWSGPQYGRY